MNVVESVDQNKNQPNKIIYDSLAKTALYQGIFYRFYVNDEQQVVSLPFYNLSFTSNLEKIREAVDAAFQYYFETGDALKDMKAEKNKEEKSVFQQNIAILNQEIIKHNQVVKFFNQCHRIIQLFVSMFIELKEYSLINDPENQLKAIKVASYGTYKEMVEAPEKNPEDCKLGIVETLERGKFFFRYSTQTGLEYEEILIENSKFKALGKEFNDVFELKNYIPRAIEIENHASYKNHPQFATGNDLNRCLKYLEGIDREPQIFFATNENQYYICKNDKAYLIEITMDGYKYGDSKTYKKLRTLIYSLNS